eukprot:346230-Rhodomonas_salina.1
MHGIDVIWGHVASREDENDGDGVGGDRGAARSAVHRRNTSKHHQNRRLQNKANATQRHHASLMLFAGQEKGETMTSTMQLAVPIHSPAGPSPFRLAVLPVLAVVHLFIAVLLLFMVVVLTFLAVTLPFLAWSLP